MFHLLDDLGLFFKRTAAFLSGKGATMTAIALASPFVKGAHYPIVGLSVGLPITAAMSTMTHHHRENAVLNTFRTEIAAHFGITRDAVTHDHLRTLAHGDAALGVAPNPFFEDILKKNDRNRWVSLGANALAALGTMAFVFARGEWLTGLITQSLGGASLFGAIAPPVAAAIGLSIASAALMFCMDHLFSSIAKDIFSEKKVTAYEKFERLAVERSNGRDLSPMQVMELAATAHPGVRHALGGREFTTLPMSEREAFLNHYDSTLHIRELTDKINTGQVRVHELAFISVGERSGVPERVEKAGTDKTAIPTRGRGIQSYIAAAKADAKLLRERAKEQKAAARFLRDEVHEAPASSAPIAPLSDEEREELSVNADTTPKNELMAQSLSFYAKMDSPHQALQQDANSFAQREAMRQATTSDAGQHLMH